MAISQAVCNTFKQELLESKHDFASGGDTFKIALYTSSATMGATTTDYSTTNETSGTGYTAAGEALTGQSVTGGSSASTAYVDFADAQWTSASFTANGALIYNTTTNGGSSTTDAVCVLAFGGDFTATSGTFTVQFPAPGTSTAILRLA